MKSKRKRFSIDEPFIAIPFSLLKSKIWEMLSATEKVVYLRMKQEWGSTAKGDFGTAFICPYDSLPASAATVSGAIKRFSKYGLIEIPDDCHGGLQGATRYFLSEKWRHYRLTPEEEKCFDAAYHKRAKERKRTRERRIQRLREWERTGQIKPNCKNQRDSTLVSKGTEGDRDEKSTSTSEANKSRENDTGPLCGNASGKRG